MCYSPRQWGIVVPFHKMPKFALQLKATLVNCTDLRPSDYEDFRWYLKLKCSSCAEVYSQWQYADVKESHSLTKGKGVCHISAKCALCSRINTLEILPAGYASYSAERNEQFQTIAKFECRGLEPVDFDPRSGWSCVGLESGTRFDEMDLNEREWADYDEKAGGAVEMAEMAFRFITVRE